MTTSRIVSKQQGIMKTASTMAMVPIVSVFQSQLKAILKQFNEGYISTVYFAKIDFSLILSCRPK
jgi:hypothetical protein